MDQKMQAALDGLVKSQAEYIAALQEQQEKLENIRRARAFPPSQQVITDIAYEQRRLGVQVSGIAQEMLSKFSNDPA